MSLASATATTVSPTARRGAPSSGRGADRVLHSPVTVLVVCLLGSAVFVADASSGEADLGLVGVALMALALAVTSTQAARAQVGRPSRVSGFAAATATAASLFVAAFLSSVGVLERMGPEVTSSAAFAGGVALMSVVLLVVLPLALVVFGWTVSRDRRLAGATRVLPWALVLVVVVGAVTVAATDGSQELWLQAAAVAVAGAVLTGFSAGLSRAASSSRSDRPVVE